MENDWRYSKDKLKLRQQALVILLKKYGAELNSTRESKYRTQSIYEVSSAAVLHYISIKILLLRM